METLNPSDPKPTAEVPLLEGLRLQWTERLLRGESYYEMQGLIHKMGEEAAKLPSYLIPKHEQSRRVGGDEDDEYNPADESPASEDGEGDEAVVYANRTERFLKTGMDRPQNLFTFQCIPRDMLKSLALGTVAYDYYPRGSKTPRGRYKIPRKGGYGVYVVGLSVKDRKGKWLTAAELQVLVRDLERYVRAYEDWSGNDNSWSETLRSTELRDLVKEVDNRIGKHDKSGPRYITSDAAKDGMVALISSLQKRVDESLKLDPTGNTQLIQTPLYVGLSTSLADMMPKHDPTNKNEGALESSNKAHGLVCSLMKVQGLSPQAVFRVVLLLWDKEDLWLWETIICAIANSLISQDGFNRTECGDRVSSKGPSIDPDAEDIVKVHHPYHYENSEATLAYLRKRQAAIERGRLIQSWLSNPIIDQARSAQEALDESGRQMDIIAERLRQELEQVELDIKKAEALEEELEMYELLDEVMQKLDACGFWDAILD